MEEASIRLSSLLDKLEISQLALSELIGVSQPYINQLVRGKRDITTKVLQKIANALPDVNTGWILNGEGRMFFSEQTTFVQEPAAQYRSAWDAFDLLRSKFEEHEKRISMLEAELSELKREYEDKGGD